MCIPTREFFVVEIKKEQSSMKKRSWLALPVVAILGLIFFMAAPYVLPPVEESTRIKGAFSEAYDVAGVIRTNFHEYRIRCLENGIQINAEEFARSLESFTTKGGVLVKWNSSPRDGVVVESSIPFEGYYIYLDLNGNLQTRKAEADLEKRGVNGMNRGPLPQGQG